MATSKDEHKRVSALPRIMLLTAWMALIFWSSAQSGVESAEKSDVIVTFLESLGTPGDPGIISFALRKAAHFFVYLALGVLAYRAAELYAVKRRAFLHALVFVFMYAVSDEIHQTFVPGRSGEISDVLLDTAGGLTGILILLAPKLFVKTK